MESNTKKLLFLISHHEFERTEEAHSVKRLGTLLGFTPDKVKHIHPSSKKRISEHWKLMLRICRNDPTSSYLIYVYIQKDPVQRKIGERKVDLYDADINLVNLAKSIPNNAFVYSLQDRCNCVRPSLIDVNQSQTGTLIQSGCCDLVIPAKEGDKSFSDRIHGLAEGL